MRGTAAWLIKQAFPVEIFDSFVTSIDGLRTAKAAPDPRLVTIRTMADCARYGETLLHRLGRQSGHGVRSIVASGGRVYALVENGEVITQLTLDLTGPVAVETPIPLRIAIPRGAGFLSYLYTYPAWRRRGLAQRLIGSALHDLSRDGVTDVITHVSSTNVNSQNTFLATGWRRTGLMLTDRHRRVLYGGPQLVSQGIGIAPR